MDERTYLDETSLMDIFCRSEIGLMKSFSELSKLVMEDKYEDQNYLNVRSGEENQNDFSSNIYEC